MTALAVGPVTAGLVRRLRAAEISKNLMLLEALRRTLARRDEPGGSRRTAAEFEGALERLERLQNESPDLMRSVLGLPQLGAWVYRSLATAGTGCRMETAYLAELVDRARRAGAPDGPADSPALAISHANLTLCVTLDPADPNLDLYGPRAEPPPAGEIAVWRARLTGAWRLIATHDAALAEAMAAGLRTLVPLKPGPEGRPRSATSGWAFGAVAMSLPPDEVSCADTLVHEFRHLLLGAVLDHFPLVRDRAGELAYAPWREDPRPPSGLLIGGHAYVGLLAFWRRQQGRRAAFKIDRWLEPSAQVFEALDTSGALTRQGRLLVTPMREALADWRAEERGRPPDRQADDAAADHRLRWRLGHLRVDAAALDALAEAWADRRSPDAVPARPEPDAVHDSPPSTRSQLLEREPGASDLVPLPSPDAAARAVLAGDYDLAAVRYKTRIADRHDRDAWAGLALCRRRTAPAAALATRPELVAALHDRLHASGHGAVDPDRLSAWLDGARPDGRGAK